MMWNKAFVLLIIPMLKGTENATEMYDKMIYLSHVKGWHQVLLALIQFVWRD